jgi:hypothetical protein
MIDDIGNILQHNSSGMDAITHSLAADGFVINPSRVGTSVIIGGPQYSKMPGNPSRIEKQPRETLVYS